MAISATDNTKKAAIKQKSGDKPLYLKDKQKDIILDFAKKNKEFVSKEIETILNLKPSRVRFLLSELVEENLLAPIGANKNRKYTLNN
ncbi:hypothetical protein [Ureaplasma diversum]|uniref:Uncharacterized protein n=1 Tax=Ureaplasma diversum NCTC 246 TaxID=1188241 RepID=A0A084EXA1_9BACT|nr:hypothetical protein [Ureaplasma diversum]KEZ22593.1 hypothetical protein UDIV_5690 [Ureaplasma diversum NCTC 246]